MRGRGELSSTQETSERWETSVSAGGPIKTQRGKGMGLSTGRPFFGASAVSAPGDARAQQRVQYSRSVI